MALKDFFDNLFGKTNNSSSERQKEDFVELSSSSTRKRSAKIILKSFIMTTLDDARPIIDSLREGDTIALIKLRPSTEKDVTELNRAVTKIKTACDAIDGKVVGIDNDWIMAVPSFVGVQKGESAAETGATFKEDDQE